jgi:hypothetical protein
LVHIWINGINPFATAPTHPAMRSSLATMAQWKTELKPVTERYLATLSARFANARETYNKLMMMTGARN